MSLWIYIRHRPSRRALPIVVCKLDIISRSVENDRSAVVEDTKSVTRILNSIFIAERHQVCKPFSKPQHKNNFDKIFTTAGTKF